jgi:hypothetical protein
VRVTSTTHLGLKLATALDRSEPLAGLLQRVRESKARLEALDRLLPPALRAGIRSGPLDDEAWQLLVDNAAVAAKLRQMLPALETELRARGWNKPPIRIKVLPRA